MTTIPLYAERARHWPATSRRARPNSFAVTLAAFLAEQPVTPTPFGDANFTTHARLRCASVQGNRVHRLDSTRWSTFYTTSCGLRVPKISGVLTASAIDCRHHGCGRGRDGEA